ncbi:TerC family protein [Paraliomyxa miuraensis]|uniref:TerC family protein n=1 Tax=Paraliomyxa miuraensis TaxID=376150 RepID=UPI0022552F0F|nr:TerC family protein [Paraliomyxa miuraensis]MCX4242127.1 TerC family protein [Paraliomyxa miuraensis]
MLELLTSPEAWVSLLVLSVMEIVLGIDNIVFITILCGRLPRERQLAARRLGLAVALVTRLLLLLGISWVMHLESTLFTLVVPWSGKDLILALGGLFLLYKATREIYENVEQAGEHGASLGVNAAEAAGRPEVSFSGIVFQVMLLDVVFSLDSVITAVGMAEHVEVMIVAVVIAVIVMMVFAGPIGDFIENHPSVRVLALAFLVLIGVMLVIEATGQHVSKGYIYSAMGFSLFVQMLNIRMDHRRRLTEAGSHP